MFITFLISNCTFLHYSHYKDTQKLTLTLEVYMIYYFNYLVLTSRSKGSVKSRYHSQSTKNFSIKLRSIITDITVNKIKETLPRDKLRSLLNFVNQVSEFNVPLDTSFLMLISKLSARTSRISRISSLLSILSLGSLATLVKWCTIKSKAYFFMSVACILSAASNI